MTPEFHPAAEKEFSASVAWYESRAKSLGARMSEEVHRAVQLVCDRPQIGKPTGKIL